MLCVCVCICILRVCMYTYACVLTCTLHPLIFSPSNSPPHPTRIYFFTIFVVVVVFVKGVQEGGSATASLYK